MKRIIFSLLGGLALMAAPVAKADNLTEEQAREAAAHYLQHTSDLTRITADQLTLVFQRDNEELNVPALYFFNAPENGWIIMAGTTVMHPVVGYMDKGSLDMSNLPPQMQVWLDQYHEMVCAVQNADAKADYPDCSEWKLLSNKQMSGNTKANDVILMASEWDQGNTVYERSGSRYVVVGTDGKTYDMLTPLAAANSQYHCPVGCVATALAQICYYYKYPTHQAKGFVYDSWPGGSDQLKLDTIVPFDYSKMANKLFNSTARSKRLEVSRLCYYVGLVVQMQYSASGSSSNSYKIMNNFPARFDFNMPTYISRSGNPQAFINSIRNELTLERPVYMDASNGYEGGSGRDAAGHAFVCDGYTDDQNMYHFNWGWNGVGNGYFNLVGNTVNDMFIDGQDLSYNKDQGVLTKLYPLHPDENEGIADVTGHATLGAPYPNPASYSVMLPYQTESAADLNIYNALGQQVESIHVQAGVGAVNVHVENMPNGVYIYRLGDAYGKFVVR